jgi:hypothetical protein
VACGGVVALRFAADPAANPLFRFRKLELAETSPATLRMLSDANWAGSGAGSYQALAAIYRDAAGIPGQTAINTITSIVLEWGHIGLLITVVFLIQLLVVLFRRALSGAETRFMWRAPRMLGGSVLRGLLRRKFHRRNGADDKCHRYWIGALADHGSPR